MRGGLINEIADIKDSVTALKSAQISGDSSFRIYNNHTEDTYDVSFTASTYVPLSAFFQFTHPRYEGGDPVVGAEPFYNVQYDWYMDSLSAPRTIKSIELSTAKITNSLVNNGPTRLYFQLYFPTADAGHTYYLKFYVQSIMPGTLELFSFGPA